MDNSIAKKERGKKGKGKRKTVDESVKSVDGITVEEAAAMQKKKGRCNFVPRRIDKTLVTCKPKIYVIKKYGRFDKKARDAGFLKNPVGEFEVYDVSSGGNMSADLSPMCLGPVVVGGEVLGCNIEDVWQGHKVWSSHFEIEKWYPAWKKWSTNICFSGEGKRHRVPVDTNGINPNVPVFHYYRGSQLGYVEARKRMYVPWYAELVQKTKAFAYLKSRYDAGVSLVLLDPDGQPRDQPAETVRFDTAYKLINDERRIFGHGWVLACVIIGIDVWSKEPSGMFQG